MLNINIILQQLVCRKAFLNYWGLSTTKWCNAAKLKKVKKLSHNSEKAINTVAWLTDYTSKVQYCFLLNNNFLFKMLNNIFKKYGEKSPTCDKGIVMPCSVPKLELYEQMVLHLRRQKMVHVKYSRFNKILDKQFGHVKFPKMCRLGNIFF